MSPRADATRNAARLVAAARELFAEQGTEAALDDVARRAGIGNATLYRHFPTRSDLLVAVYAEEVAALLAPASTVDLFTWLDAFVVHVATKRALALAINDGEQRGSLFAQWHHSITSVAGRLLEEAQHAGTVRRDLDVKDLLALTTGAALSSTGADNAKHLLTVLRRGLVG